MGICLNRRLRRFSQMGYDAPLPFVPGFWVPACAGMTVGVRGNDGFKGISRGNGCGGIGIWAMMLRALLSPGPGWTFRPRLNWDGWD